MLRNVHGKVDPVAASASQPTGCLYCSGTESGLVEIFEAGRGHVAELRRLKSLMDVEHFAWSSEGRHVAFTDLCGRLIVKSVPPIAAAGAILAIETEVEIAIGVTEGAIRQIMFDPHSTQLLIYSSSWPALCSWRKSRLWHRRG